MTIRTGSILIVEDIAHVRELIEVQLKVRGYTTMSARDGREALEQVAKEKPALVVSDILMPRLDGFALAHQLRSNPQTSDLPIIFLSATYVSVEDEKFALGLGALRFLPKPVDADELVLAVADALTGQAQAPSPMSDKDFYAGYRQRLQSKLQQKAQQVARSQHQLEVVPADQRETYQKLLAEAQEQHAELERELTALTKMLAELEAAPGKPADSAPAAPPVSPPATPPAAPGDKPAA
jgi:CheY-like chemotaxis protein